MLEPAVTVFTELGCQVERACPDLDGADEVFRTLRAWQFEISYGELLDRHPDRLKATLRDNMAEGRKLTGADVGRAEVAHTALYHRVREFFERRIEETRIYVPAADEGEGHVVLLTSTCLCLTGERRVPRK